MSLPDIQTVQYFPTCSDVGLSDYKASEAIEFDPSSAKYFEEAIENDAVPGLAIAGACLLVALLLVLGSLCLCCIPHHWRQQRAIHRLVEGHKCKRFFSFLLMASIVVFTLAIPAFSAWGIYEATDKVENAVDSSFDLIAATEDRVGRILGKTTQAVDVGRRIVAAMEDVNRDLGRDDNLRAPVVAQLVGVDDTTQELREATEMANTALDTADTEVNENLIEVHDALKDALEYRDEGKTGSDALRILIIVSFSIFIFMSLVIGCCSVFGKSAKLTCCSVVFMWLMLVVSFALGIGILNVVRNISESSCLYVDDFAIREIRDSVDMDGQRLEMLLRVYFQPVGVGNLNEAEIETLWDLPLSDVESFLTTIDGRLFTSDGQLNIFARRTTPETQQSLVAARALFPEVRESIDAVRTVTEVGGILNEIHADVKDLLCCTYHDSIDSIFVAWVCSSVAGFILAMLVTWQVLSFVKLDRDHDKYQTGPPQALPAQGQSAYMRSTAATVHYPAVQPPPQVVVGKK